MTTGPTHQSSRLFDESKPGKGLNRLEKSAETIRRIDDKVVRSASYLEDLSAQFVQKVGML